MKLYYRLLLNYVISTT